ncbi:MAG: hypothetical protein J7500_01295 [Sphingomonas sp.]|uniref:hypothetical protein n=1 Tax=Sphingomonas sp. TaxID=28214 RepID=UPI001B28142C|nr:hypothetical protein [Sphingomonas sp.]MBO9621323.1 hypothetical protein [Sphingomonas sp.]
MMFRRSVRAAAAVASLLFLASGAVAQRHAAPNALGGVELGQWQLKSADGRVRKICVSARWMLIQPMHGTAQCEHFVMQNAASSATVRYTCPGRGHGLTTLSVETPRLVSIETSGVADGSPFSEQLEGRRIGACG